MSSSEAYDPYAITHSAIQEPPDSLFRALLKIGPGIILAGSIVGSGELILTTALGADFGYQFLWLILFSCVIKVFVQIELGRFTLSSGKPLLVALNELGGPRWGANWQVWWFIIMLFGTTVQLGAMTGGVALALNSAFPQAMTALAAQLNSISPEAASWLSSHPEHPWAILTWFLAVALLLSGGYQRIELITTILVAGVTAITLASVLAVPYLGFPITLDSLAKGMTINPADYSNAAIVAAFGCFGITGVGAAELYFYPYWCIEKGYARYTGPHEESEDWVRRAKGWMRVLKLDCWSSMIVYTVATVSFYLLGAAVLNPQNLHPKGTAIINTLAEMYVPVFGPQTRILFLIGVWAVLFKTLYVASASDARLTADFLNIAGFVKFKDYSDRKFWTRVCCVIYPSVGLILYFCFREPKVMVAFGGFIQAATLPLISFSTLYLRYYKTDRRITPGLLADCLLWIAVLSISTVAFFAVRKTIVDNVFRPTAAAVAPATVAPATVAPADQQPTVKQPADKN